MKRSGITWWNRAWHQASLLAAACALYSLYYRQLLGVYLRNLRLSRPDSLLESLRMVRLIHRVRWYTAVLPPRLAALHKLSREIDILSVPGDVVECGVYNGGSAALMGSICTQSPLNRNIWLFDSFEGLPNPTDKDGDKAQTCGWWCYGDLAKVKRILQRLCVPQSRVCIVKGWFQDTFPSVQIGDIALLHIDADWYESVKLCLQRFYDNVRPGGFVVIDDYGHWEGCRRATDEFLKQRSLDVRLVRVDYTGRYFQKPLKSS